MASISSLFDAKISKLTRCRIAQNDYDMGMTELANNLSGAGGGLQIGGLHLDGRTLKMRLGWDDQSLNAPELGRLAEAEGIAMLTVHGRTRCQFYAAQADWTAIGKVKKAVSIPVAANGDCASLADAASILAQSGADAVMIGRSAIGRPWFVGDVAYYLAHGKARPETPATERKSAALEHYETLLEMFGAGQGLRHARKHLAAYAERAGVLDGAALRQRLVMLECPSAVRSSLCQLFDSPSLARAA
jgi:tRNA-dihydrouridine synthase B